MKVALYIEEDVQQIVLTPETKGEELALGILHEHHSTVSIRRGGFFRNMAGYIRESDALDSTMIVIDRPAGTNEGVKP